MLLRGRRLLDGTNCVPQARCGRDYFWQNATVHLRKWVIIVMKGRAAQCSSIYVSPCGKTRSLCAKERLDLFRFLAWRRFPRGSIERLPIFQGFRLRNHSLKSTPALTFNKFMVFVFSFSCSSSSVNRGSPSAIRGEKEEVETWLDATSFVAQEKKNVFHPIMVYGKQWKLWHLENLKK